MSRWINRSAGLVALGAFLPVLSAHSQTEAPALQDVIHVTTKAPTSETDVSLTPEHQPLEGPDLTYLLSRTPGGARIANGALSGQVQYRGLFGERLNLRVDGQRLASGGPNLMDPVFHYAPTPLIASVIVDRGVSPVSSGPGLGGGADAIFKRVSFAEGANAEFHYDGSVGVRSVDESVAFGGVAGAATESWRFNLLGSHEAGSDYDYPDGTVAGSRFKRDVYGMSGGLRFGDHVFSLDIRRQNTGASGNPPFPMDIRFFDADFYRLGYEGKWGDVDVTADVHGNEVSHAMNNYDLRPSPDMASLREALAKADMKGGKLAVSLDSFGGRLQIGIDGDETSHDMLVTNPANDLFFVHALPDIAADRFGGFAEWQGVISGVNAELGIRVDEHSSSAGTASVGSVLPMGPRMLAMAFNAADTDWSDSTTDAVARVWTTPVNGLSWRATLARKTQVPNYLQRYGWMPLSASGGLADGNIYVGDLTLDPETAWIAEAGFDYRYDKFYARPTVYVRQVDDYIQGVPFDDTVGVPDTMQEMIAAMNGDPTPLRFANVEARLTGADVDFGIDLPGAFRLDGVASYVKGERRDIDDALYRIAPFSLTAGITYEQTDWSATFEARGVSEQDEISVTNSEAETPGYAVFNLYGEWAVRDGVFLSLGIENLLDHTYRDHLSGYNRNSASDVSVGTRLPGVGRSGFVRLSFAG